MSKITFTLVTLLALTSLTLYPQTSSATTLNPSNAQVQEPITDSSPQDGTTRGTASE